MSDNVSEATNLPEKTPKSGPKLQRETVVMVNDRGRLGLLVALCSLAGVAVGFGLSNMAMGVHSHHCGFHQTAPSVEMSAPVQSDTPTWLGVRITDHADGGAHIISVEPSSPASRAGLRRGDVVTGFSTRGCSKRAEPVESSTDLVRLVRSAEPGTNAKVIYRRDGEKRAARAKLVDMPRSVFRTLYRR